MGAAERIAAAYTRRSGNGKMNLIMVVDFLVEIWNRGRLKSGKISESKSLKDKQLGSERSNRL